MKTWPSIQSFLIPFSFAVSILISPDLIAMIGHFVGNTGYWGLIAIGVSGFIYYLLSRQHVTLLQMVPEVRSEFGLFQSLAGSIFSFFPLIVKVTALLFLATGFLVSAGFVFNETFVYWFPNFGFAFLLLLALVLLQMAPGKIILNCQLLFTGVAVSGLVVLILAGFFSTAEPTAASHSISKSGSFQWPMLFTPLVFFIGMDMGFFSPADKANSKRGFPGLTILIMALLILSWSVIALDMVSLKRLSQTSISHIIVARSIWGDTGRWIMGIIVISGTLAALHALFTIIRNQVTESLSTLVKVQNPLFPKLVIIGLGLVIGLLIARGLAGYDILEVLIKGALVLWLFYYGCLSLLYQFTVYKSKGSGLSMIGTSSMVFTLMVSVIIFILTSTESILMLQLISIALVISLLTGAAIQLFNQRKTKSSEVKNDTAKN